MRYFPIFVDLKDRKVIVVGGGEEALRKVRLLLKTKARILVVAPLLHDELAAEPRGEWLATQFSANQLDGAALVSVARCRGTVRRPRARSAFSEIGSGAPGGAAAAGPASRRGDC